MDKLERMQVVVRWLIFRGIGTTQKEVAQSAGYNAAVFSAVLNGTTPLSSKFVERVCALDSQLRSEWVLSGRGEMLSGDDGFGSLPKPTGVPYYTELPVSAGDQEAPPYDDHHDYVFIPGVHAEAFFPVSGCSMSPTVNPGDLVGVVSVDRFERVDPECIYMIVTRDNERMIKHIQPTPEDDPELVLSSDNPRYAPFRRLKEDILKVFKVVYIGKNL